MEALSRPQGGLLDGALLQRDNVSYTSKARLLAGDALTYRDEPTTLLAAYELGADEPDEITVTPLEGSLRKAIGYSSGTIGERWCGS